MTTHSSPADSMLISSVRSPINTNGTAVNSSAVDMAGWDGALFTINVGVLGTNGTADASVISSANSNLSGAAVINGSALTQVVNANTVHLIDIYRPTNRYLGLASAGHTNGALISATVMRYRRTGILPPTAAAEQTKRVVQN